MKNEILIETRRVIILKKDKIKNSLGIILLILFSVLFLHGCHNAGNGVVYPDPGKGSIMIDNEAETTNTRTPSLTIGSEGADYMSFSGNGEEWTDWIPYETSYNDFDIASGEYGTTQGVGVKIVFIRFKDLENNIFPDTDFSYDEIEYILPLPPTKGSILIDEGVGTTSDSSPLITISSEGADYMSFSGDGEEWTDWLPYAESYDEFDIASGQYGTEFSQGKKYVYVRFKNENGDLSPEDDGLASDNIIFRLSNLDLKYVIVEPAEITMKVNSEQVFTVKGIDHDLNEVPLDGSKVSWSYCCNASVIPIEGTVATTYTAPPKPGRNKYIQANYDGKYKKIVLIEVVE